MRTDWSLTRWHGENRVEVLLDAEQCEAIAAALGTDSAADEYRQMADAIRAADGGAR